MQIDDILRPGDGPAYSTMVGHSQREPQFLSSTDSASLQLSTSICMPFNPYRQSRIPDHMSRSRLPTQMPPNQARVQPARAISYDTMASSTTYKPVYHPTRASMAASTENVYASSPFVTTCTPITFDMESTYLGSCQSPETADPANMWGQSMFSLRKQILVTAADIC